MSAHHAHKDVLTFAHTHLATASMRDALATATSVQTRVLQGEAKAWLMSAFIEDEALVLGRFQRAEDTLFDAMLPHLMRSTGGPAWLASKGALYVALVLSSCDAITPTPPGKLMNRNLRGLIQMGRALGAPFVYGGRELLSATGHAIGFVSQVTTRSGAVVIEALLGVETSVLPRTEQVDDAWMGPRWPMLWSSLKERGMTTSHEAILDALVTAHQAWSGVSLIPCDAYANHIAIRHNEDEAGLVWSRCIAVPAGLVTVGVDSMRIRVRGDVMQDEAADALLSNAWQETRDATGALSQAYPHGLLGVPLDALAMLIAEVAP